MSNLDNDLREMFRRRDADLVPGVVVPRNLAGRTRRRQLGTVFGSIGLVVALVAGTVIGVRSFSADRDGRLLGGDRQTQTTTINGITITYPHSWFAADPVDVGIEPDDAPRTVPSVMLILSPLDPVAWDAFGCPGLAQGAQPNLIMTVQETRLTLTGAASTPWPVPLQSSGGGADPLDNQCYPDWTFLRSSWTDAGRSFEAVVGIRNDVREDDRTALVDAYESMSFTADSPIKSHRTVVGEGTAFGSATWYLEVNPDTGEYCLNVQADRFGSGGCSPVRGAARVPQVQLMDAPRDGAFDVGTVPQDVFAVTLESSDGSVVNIDLIEPPGALEGFRYVVVPLEGEGHATLRFQDEVGNDLYPPEQIRWGGGTNSSDSPEGSA